MPSVCIVFILILLLLELENGGVESQLNDGGDTF